MGADRYSVCPRCESRKDRQMSADVSRLADAYGRLPLVEFDALRSEIEAYAAAEIPQTLREYYEFTPPVGDGVLGIEYHADCGVCQLGFKISEERTLWTREEIDS